jgi:hypothetical protein
VPSNDRVWANDCDGGGSAREQPIDQNEDQAIEATQSHTLGRLTSKNTQLMSENENFGLKSRPRLETRRNDPD